MTGIDKSEYFIRVSLTLSSFLSFPIIVSFSQSTISYFSFMIYECSLILALFLIEKASENEAVLGAYSLNLFRGFI